MPDSILIMIQSLLPNYKLSLPALLTPHKAVTIS